MDTQTFFGQQYARILAAAVLLMALLALGAYAYATVREAKYMYMGPTTINVRGEGEVLAKPDIGTFSFSVLAQADDAATAQSESATAINEIVAYLAEAEVEEKDIKTENYNLNPRYRYEEQVCPANSFCPPSEPIIDGYEVSQMVTVKVRNLDQAGDLISGVGERGATNISSLQFTIDDESELKATAREAAIADAQEKARILAEDLGVDIERMVSYYEEEGYPKPYYGYGLMEERALSQDASISPSMPTGENVVRSVVNITFQIED